MKGLIQTCIWQFNQLSFFQMSQIVFNIQWFIRGVNEIELLKIYFLITLKVIIFMFQTKWFGNFLYRFAGHLGICYASSDSDAGQFSIPHFVYNKEVKLTLLLLNNLSKKPLSGGRGGNPSIRSGVGSPFGPKTLSSL